MLYVEETLITLCLRWFILLTKMLEDSMIVLTVLRVLQFVHLASTVQTVQTDVHIVVLQVDVSVTEHAWPDVTMDGLATTVIQVRYHNYVSSSSDYYYIML